MTSLRDISDLDGLLVAASIPTAGRTWFEKPLTPDQVHVSTVRKPSGGYRVIIEPVDDGLIRVQKKLKEFVSRQALLPHPAVHGFTAKRGAYTNARAHLGAAALLTVDISDFFASISSSKIETALIDSGFVPQVTTGIAHVTTYDGALATGFSTSPVLSNLYFRESDVILSDFAESEGLTYTRYADDLTFSGTQVDDSHLAAVTAILEAQNLRVNERKIRFQRRGHPQNVTGFVIAHSDHPRVPRFFKRRLRQDLFYADKYGVDQQAKLRDVDEDVFRKQITGRISYLMNSEPRLAYRLRREYGHLLE